MGKRRDAKELHLIKIDDHEPDQMPQAEHADSPATPWGGRFTEEVDGFLLDFGASLPVDMRLWVEDILGSMAHAAMLSRQRILTEEEFDAILAGLNAIGDDIEADEFAWDLADEDVHMAIEAELTRRIGEAGKKLHTARSRNDQVATDLRLWSRFAAAELIDGLDSLIEVIERRADGFHDAIMPGYTHLQKAQPVTLAMHLEAYCAMFERDMTRFEAALDAADVNVLGSGALAGTTFPIDPQVTTSILDFKKIALSAMDGVSNRDFVLDLLYACAVCQMHMSRLCEELILWSTEEFGFVTFDDSASTGSSIMPQKKNPDFAELIRGKTGRVYGNLMALLTVMKGLPLTYNKDMQEDKEPIFDSVDTTSDCIIALAHIIDTLTFNTTVMREAADGGFMAATDLADYLVGKGMAFRDAHEVIGRLVLTCEKQGKKLTDLTAAEYQDACELFGPDVLDIITPEQMVARRQKER